MPGKNILGGCSDYPVAWAGFNSIRVVLSGSGSEDRVVTCVPEEPGNNTTQTTTRTRYGDVTFPRKGIVVYDGTAFPEGSSEESPHDIPEPYGPFSWAWITCCDPTPERIIFNMGSIDPIPYGVLVEITCATTCEESTPCAGYPIDSNIPVDTDISIDRNEDGTYDLFFGFNSVFITVEDISLDELIGTHTASVTTGVGLFEVTWIIE